MLPQEIVNGIEQAIGRITQRIRALEASDRAEVAGGVRAVLAADLPPAGQPGRLLFVTDGGTPGLYADDGATWSHV